MARRSYSPFYKGKTTPVDATTRTQQSRRKKAGNRWESELDRCVERYRATDQAHIRKVGAPFEVMGRTKRGELRGHYSGPGGCDFLGHVAGVPFEADAKHCDGERWSFSALEQHQAESLDAVADHGGHAGILLLIAGRRFWLSWGWLAPRWWAWMHTRKAGARVRPGTASLSLTDCAELGVEFHGGDFLRAVLEGGDDV